MEEIPQNGEEPMTKGDFWEWWTTGHNPLAKKVARIDGMVKAIIGLGFATLLASILS